MKHGLEPTCLSIKDKSLCAFFIILVSYTIILTGIAIWRYENFLIQESGDLILFEQIVYNTLHGRPFYASGIGNQFGYHNSPILAILVPFAAIAPVPYVLYTATVLSIAVSAIPIYLISREELGDGLALLLGSCYIMLPGLVGQVYLSFHEINLVLPFLTFGFYYFAKERFHPFLIMFILGLMVKEDVSMTFFIFSIYALIKKRDMKWYLLPAVISISWLFFSLKVIALFAKNHYYPMIGYFSELGNSFSEIIVNTVSNPRYILYKLLLPHKIEYLYILLLPVGLALPFLSSEILFVIPSLLLNLLTESSRFRLVDYSSPYGVIPIPRHMSLIATVFLFISAVYSIKKVGSLFAKQENLLRTILSLLLVAGTLYGSRFIVLGEPLYQWSLSGKASKEIKEMLSLIPPHATVRADRVIAPHLYDRREVYISEGPEDTDYMVLTGSFAYYKTVKENHPMSQPPYSGISRDDLLLIDSFGKPIDPAIRERYEVGYALDGT